MDVKDSQQPQGESRLAWMTVDGNSMSPLLRHGQRVLVDTQAELHTLRRGDIVAFQRGKRGSVMHRFLASGPNGELISRGDNSLLDDVPWNGESFAGRLVALEVAPGRLALPRRGAWPVVRLGKRLYRRDLSALPSFLTRMMLRRMNPLHLTGRKTMATPNWEIQELGRELVVHNPDTGDVHVLNASAALIWKAAAKGATRSELLKSLNKEYQGVPETQLAADLDASLEDLRKRGLLE